MYLLFSKQNINYIKVVSNFSNFKKKEGNDGLKVCNKKSEQNALLMKKIEYMMFMHMSTENILINNSKVEKPESI